MKNTKVTLVPLASDDREQFILDNQWAFKYGALQEFGKRDDHISFEGEIIIQCRSGAISPLLRRERRLLYQENLLPLFERI